MDSCRTTTKRVLLMSTCFALLLCSVASSRATGPVDLPECIQQVVDNDPSVATAEANLKASETGYLASKVRFLPAISASAGYTRTESSTASEDSWADSLYDLIDGLDRTSETYSLGASATMPLWEGGYNWANLRHSRSAVRERRWHVQEMKLLAELTAVELYYGLLRGEHLLRVGEQAEALAEGHLERAEQLHEVGAVPVSDVLKARVALSQRRLERLSLNKGLRVARSQLASAMGRGPLEDIEVVDDLDAPAPLLGEEGDFLAEAEQNRPLLLGTREAERGASAAIAMARSSGLPHVSLQGSYSWSDDDPDYDDGFLARRNYRWSTGLQVSVPIFDRLSTKESVARAHASVQAARWELERVRRQVGLEVHQAYLEMEEARMMLAAAEQAVEEAGESFRLAEERYRLGAGTSLDILDAQARLTEAETSRVEALYEIKLASARMRRAVGKGQRHGNE